MMTACEHDSLVDINQDQQNNEYEGKDHSMKRMMIMKRMMTIHHHRIPRIAHRLRSCTIPAIFNRSLMQTVPTLAVTILPRMPMDMISVNTPPPSKQYEKEMQGEVNSTKY